MLDIILKIWETCSINTILFKKEKKPPYKSIIPSKGTATLRRLSSFFRSKNRILDNQVAQRKQNTKK